MAGDSIAEYYSQDPYDACPGYEQSPFCFYCGRRLVKLDDSEGPRCLGCRTMWPRLFMDCLSPDCGNAFSHIFTPFSVVYMADNLYVAEAQGAAWCDACADWTVYRWKRLDDGRIHLLVAGFDGCRDVWDVRDHVHTDS